MARTYKTLYALRPEGDIGEWTNRSTWADGEYMAEGGVTGFLWRIAPFLQKNGVRITWLDQDLQSSRYYMVTVNQKKYTMFSKKDFGKALFWAAVPARTFALVNELLERAGSDERVYTSRGTFGGEGTDAVFLTPELFEIVNSSPLIPDDEKLMTTEEALAASC
jgi:hypothetical protein